MVTTIVTHVKHEFNCEVKTIVTHVKHEFNCEVNTLGMCFFL
jgi:hypothetical protein